jgi:hypothetical protein
MKHALQRRELALQLGVEAVRDDAPGDECDQCDRVARDALVDLAVEVVAAAGCWVATQRARPPLLAQRPRRMRQSTLCQRPSTHWRSASPSHVGASAGAQSSGVRFRQRAPSRVITQRRPSAAQSIVTSRPARQAEAVSPVHLP